MPFENVWEENGVYRKYHDHVSGKEILQAMEDVHGHKLFDSIRYVVNDFLNVTECELTASDVVTLAALDRAAALSNPHIKIAIVATEPTIQMFANLYGDLMESSPYTSKVFTDLDEAKIWASLKNK